MTTYTHALTECKVCGCHYCMGCVGEECPTCELQRVAFYAIELERKLEAVQKWCDYHVIPITADATRASLKKLFKIMEDSEFTTNSEEVGK